MTSLYYLILKNIASSLIGSAVLSWLSTTALGAWLNTRTAAIIEWASNKLKIERKKEIDAFYKKYPEISDRLDALEKKTSSKK